MDDAYDALNHPDPVDRGIARLIKEEFQAAVKGTSEIMPFQPSSEPLLSSTPADDDVTEASQQATSPPPPPDSATIWDWCKAVIPMGVTACWLLGWVVPIHMGVDPLGFSLLALMLVLALLTYFIFGACYTRFHSKFTLAKPESI